MSSSLSFKDYLKSKQVLVEALSQTPKTTTQYIIKKYCKVTAYNILDNSTSEISLKPKQIIVVECTWPNHHTPEIHSFSFQNNEYVDSTEKFMLPWKNEKILTWLDKNTKLDSWLTKLKIQTEDPQ